MKKAGRKLGLVGATTSPDLIARRAVWAACFGFFVDMFDVYLPIAVLAPALAYFIPAGLSGATQATIFYGYVDRAPPWGRDLRSLWGSTGPAANNADLSGRLRHCNPRDCHAAGI
jgi:hypothetical protein